MSSAVGSAGDTHVLQVVFHPDGTGFVRVELHGDVCAGTVDLLAGALTSLVDGGAANVVVDVNGLRLCTSHGFDLFDRLHARLRDAGGSLCIINARGVVARIMDMLRAADPPFLTPSA